MAHRTASNAPSLRPHRATTPIHLGAAVLGLLGAFIAPPSPAPAQIVVQSGGTALELAQAVIPSGVTIHSAQLAALTSFDGSMRNFGTFSAISSGYGLAGGGVVLGSGDVRHAAPEPGDCAVGLQPRISDTLENAKPEQIELLDRALGVAPYYAWYDAAQLDIVLSVPTDQRLVLRVVFASEEYPEYGVCPPGLPAAFGDALGIFLDGPDGCRIYRTTMPGGAPFAVGSQNFCLTFPRDVIPGCPGGYKPGPTPTAAIDTPEASLHAPPARFPLGTSPSTPFAAGTEGPGNNVGTGVNECFELNTNCISGVLASGDGSAVHSVPIELKAATLYTLTFIIGDRQDYQRDSFALIARGSLMRPCPADFNADGLVNDADFVIFAADYEIFSPSDNSYSDLNGDSFVDDADFVQFASAYGNFGCPP